MIFHFCQGIETKSSINVYMSIESVWRNLQDILLMISPESDWEQQYITICSFLTSTMQNLLIQLTTVTPEFHVCCVHILISYTIGITRATSTLLEFTTFVSNLQVHIRRWLHYLK